MRFSVYFLCSILTCLFLVGVPRSLIDLYNFFVLGTILVTTYFASAMADFALLKLMKADVPKPAKAHKPRARKKARSTAGKKRRGAQTK